MRRIRLVVLVVTVWLTLAACSAQPSLAVDAGLPPSPWDGGPELPTGLSAFAGVNASLPADDLAPLDALVGDAQLIGLGEAIHTSGGFYAFKEREIEHLVRDQGLRVFAMETPRTEAEALNRYIQHCHGGATNVYEAMHHVFSVFADDHTQHLFEWLCAFNVAHPDDRVQFYGFDVQQPGDDAQALTSFFTDALGPDGAAPLLAQLSTCKQSNNATYDEAGGYLPYSTIDVHQCLAGLNAVDATLAQKRDALTSASNATQYALAVIAATSFRAFQNQVALAVQGDFDGSFQARDVGMFNVLRALRDLSFSNQRVVVWAHNAHLAMTHPAGRLNLGSQLAGSFGSNYAPVGLIAYRIGLNWPGIGTGEQPLPAENTLEAALHGFNAGAIIADPTAPMLARDGAPWVFAYGGGQVVPAQQYRAIVYLDESPGMSAIFW